MDDVIVDMEETDEGEPKGPTPFRAPLKTSTGRDTSRTMFVDIETIPDWETIDDVPPRPEDREGVTDDEINDALFDRNVQHVKKWLETVAHRITPKELDLVEKWEKEHGQRARKGVLQAVESLRKSIVEGVEKAKKKYATSPEHCRVVGIGIATADQPVYAYAGRDEAGMLETFWEVAEVSSPIVGFNHVGFDLPAIMVRSAMLGLWPSRKIDLNPYGTDTVDLMRSRFGNRGALGLKQLAKRYRLHVPEPDVDGGDVQKLFDKGDFLAIRKYVASDVEVTRQLFHFYSGYFIA